MFFQIDGIVLRLYTIILVNGTGAWCLESIWHRRPFKGDASKASEWSRRGMGMLSTSLIT